jgi:uncharacterized protein (DUF1800 family)
MSELEGAIAATRFGLGARPGEIKTASSDARGWLKAQVRPDAGVIPPDGLLSAKDVIQNRVDEYGQRPPMPPEMQKDQKVSAKQQEIRMMLQKEAREGLQKEVLARAARANSTADPFAERWVRFWSNHFTAAAKNAQMIGLVGPFEREAIRPHVFGPFNMLLGASSFHPAMLTYLDAARSFGPSTQIAQRRKIGLNENLAREILELHTMGVDTGYTQGDVIEFAKALTGWTIGGPQTMRLATLGAGPGQGLGGAKGRLRQAARTNGALSPGAPGDDAIGETIFIEALHEPGVRTVLAKSYGGAAKTQAAVILDDLARHPATARHIGRKLARHFIADDPPPAAVARIEAAFTQSHGDLAHLAKTIIDMPEAWGPTPQKFKTPEELLVSVARATSGLPADKKGNRPAFGDQRAVYQSLGQQPFSAPSPAGWPDDTASWSGSDAVMKRLEWANSVARRLMTGGLMTGGLSPTDFLDLSLGPIAGDATRKAVSRAESAEQGFTIALMSPEFQRR